VKLSVNKNREIKIVMRGAKRRSYKSTVREMHIKYKDKNSKTINERM
jgi:hypothetical protein